MGTVRFVRKQARSRGGLSLIILSDSITPGLPMSQYLRHISVAQRVASSPVSLAPPTAPRGEPQPGPRRRRSRARVTARARERRAAGLPQHGLARRASAPSPDERERPTAAGHAPLGTRTRTPGADRPARGLPVQPASRPSHMRTCPYPVTPFQTIWSAHGSMSSYRIAAGPELRRLHSGVGVERERGQLGRARARRARSGRPPPARGSLAASARRSKPAQDRCQAARQAAMPG